MHRASPCMQEGSQSGSKAPPKPYIPKVKGLWSADAKAELISKMQPSERPFAQGGKSKGWLEAASTPMGRIGSSSEASSPTKTTQEEAEQGRRFWRLPFSSSQVRLGSGECLN